MHRLRQFISWKRFALIALCLGIGLPESSNAQSQVSWNFLGPFGAPARVVMIAADPRTDSVLYVVAPGGGVWKTTDSAQSWTALSDSISSLQVCSVAIDPRSPDVLYLGTGDDQSPRPLQGVAVSSDGGRTWAMQARFSSQPVCAVAVDPTNSARVFAGSAEGLFISSDAGATWTKAVASPVSSIAFDSQGIAYAGTVGADSGGSRDHVLIRSSDNGKTWINISLPANPFASTSQTTWVNVTVVPGAISVLVSYEPTPFLPGSSSSANSALSVVDFYQSADGGNTWSTPARAGQARPPTQLLTDTASGTLYVIGSTLLTSANQGSTWAPITTTTNDFHTAVFTGGMLLLGGEEGLESVSLVQGTTPRAIPQLPAGQFLGVSLDSHNAVWTAGPAGLFGPVSSIVPSNIQEINAVGSVGATANSTDIFTAGNKQVAGSTDGGQNFSVQDVIASEELRAPFPPLLVDPVNNASVFVAGTHLYHSTNSGKSWTALPVVDSDATHVVIAMTLAPASRTTLYAATACLPEVVVTSCPATSLIWRSANSGQTWTQEGSVSGYVNRLAVDPRQNNTVYAAIGAFPAGLSLSAGYTHGDLLQSTTMGSTWNSIRTNLPNVPVNAVVIDPTSLPPLTVTGPAPGTPFGGPGGPARFVVNQPAQTLYVATDAGVFVTFNLGGGGNNLPAPQWTDISSGLPPTPVTDISLRQPDGILVAATFGRGVYSTSTTGLAAGVIVSSLSIETTVMQGTTGTAAVPLINVSTTNSFGWRLNSHDSWLTVIQANGTLTPRASTQVPVRIAAAGLQNGTYLGRLQFISGAFVQNIFITAHVTSAPAQMMIVGGNNASGVAGSVLPALQVMVLDGNQKPLAGIPVTFGVTTGGGSVSVRTAFTDNSGIASTVVTLPPNPGVFQLVAASGGLSVTFTVTAINAPSLLANSVVDGVTFNPYMSPAPGSIISISGQNLSLATLASGAGALPQILGTTRVLLVTAADTVPLPLQYVSPGQINALLPTNISPGSYSLRVETASVPSNDIPLLVASFDPGILTQNGTGRGSGIFIKSDGSVVTVSNPADRGSTITLFAAGLGAVNPPVAADQPCAVAEPFNRTVAVPRVFFDIYSADLIYSGLPAGAPTPYQVTVRVPAQLTPATNISVSLAIGGFESNRVTIPVQ
jgi:uncharacterized protein (TIGR03437 family)